MNPANMLREAKKGGKEAIERLKYLCTKDDLTFLRVLEVLFHHIEKPIPTTLGSPETVDSEPQLQEIGAVLQLLAAGLTNWRKQSALTYVAERWSNLHKWLCFLVEEILEASEILGPPPPDEESEPKLRRMILVTTTIILKCFTEPPACNITQLPGYVSIAVRLYIYTLKRRLMPLHESQLILVVEILFKSFEHRNEFARCIMSIPYSTEAIAANLMIQIRRKDAYDSERMLGSLLCIAGWTGVKDRFNEGDEQFGACPELEVLNYRFIADGSIRRLLQVISLFASSEDCVQRNIDLRGHLRIRILILCAGYICFCMQLLGPSPVIEATVRGLVQAIDLTLELIEDPSLELHGTQHLGQMYEVLLFKMHMFQFHPVVFRVQRQHLQHYAFGDHRSGEWNDFRMGFELLIHERREYKKTFRRICANSECPSGSVLVRTARQCGGCLSARYCSRDCQKIDWKMGHSTACRPPPVAYSLKTGPAVDRDFTLWALYSTFAGYKNWPQAYEMRQTKLGEYPVVVTIDFRFYRLFHCTQSGQEFLESPPLTGACDEESWEVAKTMVRTKGGDTLVYCLIPDTRAGCIALYRWVDHSTGIDPENVSNISPLC
ncbi:hypothetical protein C8J56DRAFT_921904 [Mycena floridula]|nr:hypothetical protein C8J56DRAFT_921904 [Mycena floridula]